MKTLIVTLLPFVIALLPGCSSVDHEAFLVLQDLAAGSGYSRLKADTPAPGRHAIHYETEGRRYQGDLYLPGESALARLVLVPGMEPRGRDDPRLVSFATTLARARFAVLVPDLPDLRRLQIGIDDAQGVADAFAYLVSAKGPATGVPAGLGAFSYAAGPALLAALGRQTRDRVDFVLAVGGYHDLHRVIAFFTTGYFVVDGEWRRLSPNAYGKWAFVHANLERLDDPADREALRGIAERRMTRPAAAVDDLVSQLGPQGLAVHRLLDNSDPHRTPRLIAELPPRIRADIDALNLADKDLHRLAARVILVHGRDDNIIPYSESIALAARLPPEQVELFLVDGLLHVDLQPDLFDSWRLWRAIQTVLKERAPAN